MAGAPVHDRYTVGHRPRKRVTSAKRATSDVSIQIPNAAGQATSCALNPFSSRSLLVLFSSPPVPPRSSPVGVNLVPTPTDQSTQTSFQPVAAVLGWIFPGLGHITTGNVLRGLWAMAGVLLLFVSGVLVGGIDCVDQKEDRLWFIGQAACGPIAFATSYANEALLKSGSAAPMIPLPPSVLDPQPKASAFKGLAHANDFGTFLVFLAGLMNACVVLDALVRVPRSDTVTSGRRVGDAGLSGGAA